MFPYNPYLAFHQLEKKLQIQIDCVGTVFLIRRLLRKEALCLFQEKDNFFKKKKKIKIMIMIMIMIMSE